MGGVKVVFGLLTLVTIGMIIGALFQVAFIRQLEESSGSKFSLSRRMGASQSEGRALLSRGLALWANDEDARVLRLGLIKPEVVSWSPRITVFHNFLSPEECDYLKAIARPRLQISTVVDAKTGKGIKSNVRTSSGMFLSSTERKYPMIQEIEKRIAVYSQVPAENGELIQVLRYEKNQYYKPHHDYFSDTAQRIATMLMYLSDLVQGGETYFPMTLWVTVLKIVGEHLSPFVWLHPSAARIQEHILQAGDGECSCGGKMVKGLCVKPSKGDAVLFWSMDLDGTPDAKSVHGGCEVLDGEKWSATKWMRQKTSS